jgi:C-terminal processing protease CtpA/Prc
MRTEEFVKEKSRFTFRSLLIIFSALIFVLVSCEKEPDPDPDPDPDPELPEEILILNEWIWEGMNEVYLWEQFIPTINYTQEPDPKAFFNKLLYEDDRDSWITEDYDALIASFQGVQLSNGMAAQPGLINNNDVISVVQYVTPNSPAAEAGVQRGDVIISIDGEPLTASNYFELYYQTTATFEFGSYDGENVVHDGRYVEITSIELNQNPVLHREVIEYEGARIGYFVYTQFTSGQEGEWLDTLNAVFDEFITAGVTDVVVDLRYNPGGSLDLSAYIASTLGSATAMENNEVYVKLVWNDLYNEYWKQADLNDDGRADGENSFQLVIKLPDSDRNMNLPRVYFLTTDGTASASESLIIGLEPYTDVIQVGTATYGKCYGSITLDDWENPKRHNWAMQPIVIKYSNAEGLTDFVDGLDPDYFVQEYLLELAPFGSFEDPLLARALEDITGIAPVVTKSARIEADLDLIPVPRKRLPERVIEWPERQVPKELY